MKRYNYLPNLLPHQLQERAEDEVSKLGEGYAFDDETYLSAKEIRDNVRAIRRIQKNVTSVWKKKNRNKK